MQTAGKPSYYDPEGETIYLSSPAASEAGAPKKGRRRGPELNDVFGYVGSATLLVAHASVRKSILRRLRGFDASPRHRRGFDIRTQVSLRRESDFAQAPRRRRLHEPLRVRVRRLQLLLQESLRAHVPRDLLVRHRVRCHGEALHIEVCCFYTRFGGRTGITRGQGGNAASSAAAPQAMTQD